MTLLLPPPLFSDSLPLEERGGGGGGGGGERLTERGDERKRVGDGCVEWRWREEERCEVGEEEDRKGQHFREGEVDEGGEEGNMRKSGRRREEKRGGRGMRR